MRHPPQKRRIGRKGESAGASNVCGILSLQATDTFTYTSAADMCNRTAGACPARVHRRPSPARASRALALAFYLHGPRAR
eukprot:2885641-Prymnesium_polylepis.2